MVSAWVAGNHQGLVIANRGSPNCQPNNPNIVEKQKGRMLGLPEVVMCFKRAPLGDPTCTSLRTATDVEVAFRHKR